MMCASHMHGLFSSSKRLWMDIGVFSCFLFDKVACVSMLMPRSAVVTGKNACMLLSWIGGYVLCFAIRFEYHAYDWGDKPVFRIVFSAALWWIFAVWAISPVVLGALILPGHAEVSICTMGAVTKGKVRRRIRPSSAYHRTCIGCMVHLSGGVTDTAGGSGSIFCTGFTPCSMLENIQMLRYPRGSL